MSNGQSWRGRSDQPVTDLALRFAAGRDITARDPIDLALLPYDLWNTEAHNIMLWKSGIIGKRDIKSILKGMDEIRAEWKKGLIDLDPGLEDVHMNIETKLSEKIGAKIGGKVHTGRSRNDQVACDMRMYLREKVLEMTGALIQFVETLLDVAGEHLETVMPGFTHYQHATISTFAHLMVSYAQAYKQCPFDIAFSYLSCTEREEEVFRIYRDYFAQIVIRQTLNKRYFVFRKWGF